MVGVTIEKTSVIRRETGVLLPAYSPRHHYTSLCFVLAENRENEESLAPVGR